MRTRIVDLDYQGRGIARIDNVVTFISGALVDELVEFEIVKKSKSFNEGRINLIIEENKNRVIPKCPYYGKCGGCDLMHMNYESQLKFKEKRVKDTIYKFTKLDVLIKPIIKSNEIYNYRNKITFHVSNNKIGYYEKNSNDFIPINNCLLCDNEINALISKIETINLTNVSKVIIRISKYNKEKMIILETTKDIDVSSLSDDCIVYLNINNKYICKSNNKKIIEKMGDLKFNISPSAFFQVNTFEAIKLYDKVKEYAALKGKEKVLDLYCGTGTIGLYLAEQAEKVYGIEINEEAIKDANENKKLNNIKNAEFYSLNANQFLNKIKEKIDVLILDPPRSGLDKKTIDSILKLNPQKIIYVSCDVATLARDLDILKEFYNIKEATPVDMFPNTYHCESVCILERR